MSLLSRLGLPLLPPGRPRWCDILLDVFQMAGRRTRLAISLLLIYRRRSSRCSSIPFALTLRSVSCAPKKKKKTLQKTKAGRLGEALAGTCTYTCPAHMWRICKSSCINISAHMKLQRLVGYLTRSKNNPILKTITMIYCLCDMMDDLVFDRRTRSARTTSSRPI